ncbi:DUF2306 domain-containing protein [Sphingomonas mesophila]|uniref:DUF2306 domain-containing protein n=1 Tax=Sphingomonas mesophila TaxID=2303576 RepID=UPI000E58015B|nr:DUF2306 domain-containing protein [Sphingomonas mesophila]
MPAIVIARQKIDLPPWARIAISLLAGGIFAVSFYAVMRALLGLAADIPSTRNVALIVHLATVIPALPLGAYVLLSRKGGPRHRLLGRVWLGLMFTTAVATIFIRDVNDGNFSWIHLFTVLTFIAVPKAILTARQGKIEAHRKHLRNFFLGSLIIAGAFSFAPGRTMWHMLFSHAPASVAG